MNTRFFKLNDLSKRPYLILILSSFILLLNKNDQHNAECMRRVVNKALTASPQTATKLYEPTVVSSQERQKVFEVNKTNAATTSAEHAEVNPVYGENGVQHPSYSQKVCEKENCQDTICNKPCAPVIENSHVAHGTHDGQFPETVFMSFTDLSGDSNRPQYAVMYEEPVVNTDTAGVTTDAAKTAQLHADKTHLDNLQLNASKEPAASLNYGVLNPDETIN